MIGLLGKKLGMTQIFDKDGNQVPVTVLEIGPCAVLQIKKKETDGYQAVQLGFDAKKLSRTTKAEQGHFKKSSAIPKRFVREIRTETIEGLETGKEIQVNNFSAGDFIDVVGTSIGKGFQGVVKRLNYKGGLSKSHGSMFGRLPGSIGAKAGGKGCRKKVRKGKGLPGQMGHERVTIQNLLIHKVDLEHHLMAVHGAVPGPENSYVIVREALRKRRPRKWKLPTDPMDEIKMPEKKMPMTKVKKAAEAAKKKPAAPAPAKKG